MYICIYQSVCQPLHPEPAGKMDRQPDRRKDRQAGRQTDRKTDRRMDGWMVKQVMAELMGVNNWWVGRSWQTHRLEGWLATWPP